MLFCRSRIHSVLFVSGMTLCVVPAVSAATSSVENNEVKLPVQVSSATGFRQQALLAPSAITVIDKEQISSAPASDLGEVFRDIPGVDIVDSGVSGMKRLSIRGESSRRVLIKINGQPLPDHSNYGTPLLIDPNMIERIEIVRGSASVVHGSNAVGGVINITTRKTQAGEQDVLVSGGYYSATRGYRASAGVLGATESLDYRIQASRLEHDDRRIPHGQLEGSDSNDKSVSAELGYRMGNSRVAWQADYFNQEAYAWMDPTPPLVFTLGFPTRESKRNALSYVYENNEALFQRVEALAYYQEGTRVMANTSAITTPLGVMPSSDALSDDSLTTGGLQLTTQGQWLGDNITVMGVEYQQDELEAVKTDKRFMPPNTPAVITNQLAEQSFWSAFIQQQVILTDAVESHLGLRYYQMDSELKNSDLRNQVKNKDDQILGSVGLVWRASQASALRANIAQGYTYPSVTQQFSATPGNRVMNFGNPDLKPEKATTFEVGYRVDGNRLLTDLTLYHVRSTDFIDKQLIGTPPAAYIGTYPASSTFFEWVNVSEAETYGAELSLAYQLDNLRPYTNLSIQKRKLIYTPSQATWKSGLPIYRARAGVEWSVLSNLSIDMFLRSYGKSEHETYDAAGVAKIVTTSTNVTPNLSAQYQPTQNLNVTLALSNLMNREYRNPEELPAAERAVDVEVHWRF